MTNTEEMMEFLFTRRASNLPPQGLGKIMDSISWSMDDDGREIFEVRDRWLNCDNREKVEIALAMEEVFPCRSRQEMVVLFAKLTTLWPDLVPTCEAILENWDRQMGSYTP